MVPNCCFETTSTAGNASLSKREAQWGREVRCIPALRPEGDSRIDVAVLPRKMISLKRKVVGPDSGGQKDSEFKGKNRHSRTSWLLSASPKLSVEKAAPEF